MDTTEPTASQHFKANLWPLARKLSGTLMLLGVSSVMARSWLRGETDLPRWFANIIMTEIAIMTVASFYWLWFGGYVHTRPKRWQSELARYVRLLGRKLLATVTIIAALGFADYWHRGGFGSGWFVAFVVVGFVVVAVPAWFWICFICSDDELLAMGLE